MNSMLSLRVVEADKAVIQEQLAIMNVLYILNPAKDNDSKKLIEFYIPKIAYSEAIRVINYSAMTIFNHSDKKLLRIVLKPQENVQNCNPPAAVVL